MSDHSLLFIPSTAGDTRRYEVSGLTAARYWRDDIVTDMSITDLARLAASDDWRDRIRAEQVRAATKITLPDGFPCIYETADSPSQKRSSGIGGTPMTPSDSTSRPYPWVVSPDLDMLTELLPEYQAMWDDYTEVMHPWWGPDSRRTFAVGHLDGLRATGVYRVGTTVDEVLRQTASLHGLRLPARLGGKQGNVVRP